MHFRDPVSQGLPDEIPDHGMVAVGRVAATGEIEIFSMFVKQIIDSVIQAAKTACCPLVAAFASVVVDHIEVNFDPGTVQFPDHFLEFRHRLLRIASIGRFNCKKRHRVVTPEVFVFFSRLRIMEDGIVFIKFRYWHQFNGRDTQFLQIGYFFDDSPKCSRGLYLRTGVLRKTPDVQLVDDDFRERGLERPVILPVKIVFCYQTAWLCPVVGWPTPASRSKQVAIRIDEQGMRTCTPP